FGIQQAMAGNGLVFCSTTLTNRLLESNLLQQFDTRPVKSDLCYYVPNRVGFETSSAAKFLDWIDAILNRTPGRTNV
ncbi:MAG: LysR family transcriptional regulator, partial [Cellvibrionaceae bacterium]